MIALIAGIFIGTAIGILVYFLVGFLRRRALFDSLSLKLFLVRIPKELPLAESKEKEFTFKSEINKFEQLISNLASFRKPFVFEVAVPHIGEEIYFYIAAPTSASEVAIKQIHSLWPGASVTPADDDYNIFNSSGSSVAGYFLQKENYALPIRTYNEIGADVFSSILGGFSKINEIGEGGALQIIVRPADSDAKKRIHGYIEALKKGESLRRVFSHMFPFEAKEIGHVLNPKKEEEERREIIVDEEAVKALEYKISKPLFQVNVRIVASASSRFQANDILDGIAAGFAQVGAPERNEFRFVKPKNPRKVIYNFSYRKFDPSETLTLNSEEVATICHFPISSTETPKVKWLKAKEAPPPVDLPNKGVLIGESLWRGERKKVYITDEDRRRHIYVIGQTGTGKTTMLANMIVEDIQKGRGVSLIDPHGDFAESILSHIPNDRLDDLIYFDPGNLERPLGLNMLDYNFNRPEEKTFIVNEMQNIFNKLFPPETMGPMFEQYMRNALLLLMEDMPNEPATLIEVPRVFTDSEYRERKLERINNPVVIDFWEKEAIKAGGEASLANMTPYITSKFNNFISNDYMRPIIGQAKSAFNFRNVMDEGKILLINLSKGRIGDINAYLLGMIFTGKILMAALSRVDIPQIEKRKDFTLYIDEFQNFTTDSIATILAEARKYGLSLVIAHQFIAQLTEKIRDAVFGNVGSQIVFRVGAQDAEFLVKQFEPIFTESDLINIDNFNAYVKILINGRTSKPFNIVTFPLGKGDYEKIEKLKMYSQLKYGEDRAVIEREIYKRLRE